MSKSFWVTLKQEYKGMKMKLFFAGLFLPTLIWGQIDATVNTAVDTTQVRLAEQINLTLQVKADSLAMIEFHDSFFSSLLKLCGIPHRYPTCTSNITFTPSGML